MRSSRKIGAILLALAAVIVYFTLAPAKSDYQSQISAAKADYAANDAKTEGAPQQAVVNGWIARDMLSILADENASGGSDPRVPALLLIGVLGILLIALTPERLVAVTPPPYDGPTGAAPVPQT